MESWKIFSIDEKLHNRKLALLCIHMIKAELSVDTPGTGYLNTNKWDIPRISENSISEHLWYACTFWIYHLLSKEDPGLEWISALHELLTQKLVLWLELTVCKGQLQDLSPLIDWIDVSVLMICTRQISNL